MSEKIELSPQEIFLLAKTSAGALVFIILVELIKTFAFPGITLLASHILTIFIVTFSFVFFFNYFLHRVAKDKQDLQEKLTTATHELEKLNLLIAGGELKISDLKKEINSPHTHV